MSPVPHITATILWTSLSEGYYSLLVWFVFLLASFMSWWVDEKTKGSMGLLFWLITRARVTAVSVIKPVMMIWFHQAGRIKKTLVSMSESGESVKLCSVSASLWGFSQSMPGASQAFPHWTQRGCAGAKHGLPTEATVTLKRGVGPNGQLKSHNETWLTITSAVWNLHSETDFYIQHSAEAGHETSILFWYWLKCVHITEYWTLPSSERWHQMPGQILSFVCLYFDKIVPDLNDTSHNFKTFFENSCEALVFN